MCGQVLQFAPNFGAGTETKLEMKRHVAPWQEHAAGRRANNF